MKPAEYRRMYEAEAAQWWYAGQRAIAEVQPAPFFQGIRDWSRTRWMRGDGGGEASIFTF